MVTSDVHFISNNVVYAESSMILTKPVSQVNARFANSNYIQRDLELVTASRPMTNNKQLSFAKDDKKLKSCS